MLVLTRKVGESIMINDNIQVTVLAVEGETIKLGIEAPKHISIHRQEVYLAIQQENREASHLNIDLNEVSAFKRNSADDDNSPR